MKRTAIILMSYGVFLILAGLAGYLSNPEKAKTALMSGGIFGVLSIGLGGMARAGWSRARLAGLGLAAFLGAVFVWRATVTWQAVAGGAAEKLTAAILISTMLAGTAAMAGALLKQASRRVSTSGPVAT